jgi:uncharacterized protein YdcH (DUF465 family)
MLKLNNCHFNKVAYQDYQIDKFILEVYATRVHSQKNNNESIAVANGSEMTTVLFI